MALKKALVDAYTKMEERGWDTIYWAIDLHGVCLKSNYEQGGYEWINDKALEALRLISSLKESKIILWSSVHYNEKIEIKRFFFKENIRRIIGFNDNDREDDTEVSCFDQKFYFSILLDDKAGFDPDEDWDTIIEFLKGRQKMSEKKVVHYSEVGPIQMGESVILVPVDHPEPGFNGDNVITTRVQNYDPKTGVFETKNTIYKPNLILG